MNVGGFFMSGSILILNGSPRKTGNTAYLVDRLIEGAREENPGAAIEVIHLNALKIGPCRACDVCRREGREGQYCAFKDDMSPLYQKVVEADAIVFASPIYWFSVTAQTKLFIDRLYGLWLEKTRVFEGKTVAALLVYGDEDPYSSGAVNAIRMIEDAARYCKAHVAGVVYGTANDIGDAQKSPELCNKAKALGRVLLQPAKR
jgi:multimeric flavodoxin WrbA